MQLDPKLLMPHRLHAAVYGDGADDALVESVRERGVISPLVATRTNGHYRLIAGHRRREAAIAAGLKGVDVQLREYDSETAEHIAVIESNRQRTKHPIQIAREGKALDVLYATEAAERERRGTDESGKAGGRGRKTLGQNGPRVSQDDSKRTRERVAKAVGLTSGKAWTQLEKAYDEMPEVVEASVDMTTLKRAVKQRKHEKFLATQIESARHTKLSEGVYDVIVVDPPWQYNKRPNDPTHRARCPYPSMSVEQMKKLKLPAAPNCALWLWTTNAHMRDAFALLDSWGFAHKTILTWVKTKIGVGDWLRGQTEHCLLATHGKPVVKLTNQSTALMAQAQDHSRKPVEFFELVESLCVGQRRLEMFARGERNGWAVHGAESNG